jgi:hypothetical protein
MAVPAPSMLSAVADALRSDINTHVSGAPKVSVGTPASAEAAAAETDPRVNLFFYGFAPSGFEPEIGAQDSLRLRLRCIVTAFGPSMPDPASATGATISGGEVDLRLLGGVIQHFHANPVREVAFARENPVSARTEEIRTALQIVFTPMQAEEINQIWAAQGDTAYRPSVAYEIALLPITPWTPTAIPAPAGAVALDLETFELSARRDAGGAGGGPRLDRLTEAELAAVRAGKEAGFEVEPTLSYDAAPGQRRMTVLATVAAGGAVTPDPATLSLTYAQAADLGEASLVLHRRAGGAWAEVRREALSVPASGGDVAIAYPVPAELGEFVISVEAERESAAPSVPPRRSNPLGLTVARAPEGGS